MTDYHRIRAINWSTLTHLGRSPLHYRHAVDRGFPDSAAMRKGRLMHCLVLTPHLFDRDYAVWDKRRAGKEWEAFKAAHKDREIVTESELAAAKLQAAAVAAHPAASALLAQVPVEKREAVLRWEEPGIGPAKARLDAIGPSFILDLKSCRDAAPGPFARSVVAYSYHGQLSWYQRPFRGSVDAYLIAVEGAAPYDVVVYQLPEHVLAAGDELVERRLSRLRHCLTTQQWRGVSDDVLPLELPDWALGTGADAEAEDTLFGGTDDG